MPEPKRTSVSRLFLGGPWHGQRHEIPASYTLWRVPVMSKPRHVGDFDAPIAPHRNVFDYVVERAAFGRSPSRPVELFVPMGAGQQAAMDLLTAYLVDGPPEPDYDVADFGHDATTCSVCLA